MVYSPDEYREDFLDDVNLYLALNGVVIDSFPMEKSEDPFPPYLDEYTFTFDKYSVKLKPKDKLDVYAVAKHLEGYKVKMILESYALDGDGEPDNDRGFSGNQKTIID